MTCRTVTTADVRLLPQPQRMLIAEWANQPALRELRIRSVVLTDDSGCIGRLEVFVTDRDGQFMLSEDNRHELQTREVTARWPVPFPTEPLTRLEEDSEPFDCLGPDRCVDDLCRGQDYGVCGKPSDTEVCRSTWVHGPYCDIDHDDWDGYPEDTP